MPSIGSTCSAGVGGVGDVGTLYAALSDRLERIVRFDVRTDDAVIEDACQFAWTKLVDHRDRVRPDAVLSWLARTAVHEAFKLIRREDRELSLEAAAERAGEGALAVHTPGPDELAEHAERLHGIRALSQRQQRMLWLHGLGLSYAEIAAYEGCTNRTVERQLLRGKRALREAFAS